MLGHSCAAEAAREVESQKGAERSFAMEQVKGLVQGL